MEKHRSAPAFPWDNERLVRTTLPRVPYFFCPAAFFTFRTLAQYSSIDAGLSTTIAGGSLSFSLTATQQGYHQFITLLSRLTKTAKGKIQELYKGKYRTVKIYMSGSSMGAAAPHALALPPQLSSMHSSSTPLSSGLSFTRKENKSWSLIVAFWA